MTSFLWEHRWYVLMNIFSLLVIVGSVWYVVRPTPIPPPVSLAEVGIAEKLGLEWMNRNYGGGVFRYELDPETNETPNTENALRQLMGSRVVAVEANTDPGFVEIHQGNLEYVFENWYLEDEGGGFVYFKDKSKLGANAMLLRTLVASPDYETHKAKAQQLAKGIATLQNEDGSFRPWYFEPDYEYDAAYLLNFYSGEALLALVEYYNKSGDEQALITAQKAADYYISTYVDQIDEYYHPAYVPWHTMAYYHLYNLKGDRRYEAAIYTMNDRLLALLDTTIRPGRFYKLELEAEGQEAPHSSSDAVYLEGLVYDYEIAEKNGETERAQRYREAIELATTRLISLQYQQSIPSFDAETDAYIGAIPVREGTPRIRVDTTQHALDAFAKYLEVFDK